MIDTATEADPYVSDVGQPIGPVRSTGTGLLEGGLTVRRGIRRSLLSAELALQLREEPLVVRRSLFRLLIGVFLTHQVNVPPRLLKAHGNKLINHQDWLPSVGRLIGI